MWTFRGDAKERAGIEKTVKVNGTRFRIRRINPLMDYNSNELPQVFTSIVPGRREPPPATYESMQKAQEDIAMVLQAGVVDPPLKKAKKGVAVEGLTAWDLLRDFDTALKLYIEVVDFSLNRLSGLRGLFFSTARKLTWYLSWRRSTAGPLSRYSFRTEATP